jgi:hypothetical protein
LSEDDLLVAVLLLMKMYGWRSFHSRPARTDRGWRTPVSGDGKGFVDIFAVKGERALAVELKSDAGTLRPEQRLWLAALEAAGIETHVWKPQQFSDGTISGALAGSTRGRETE